MKQEEWGMHEEYDGELHFSPKDSNRKSVSVYVFPDKKFFTLEYVNTEFDGFSSFEEYEYKTEKNGEEIKVFFRLYSKKVEPRYNPSYRVKDGVVMEVDILHGKDGEALFGWEEELKKEIKLLKHYTEWFEVEEIDKYGGVFNIISFLILYKYTKEISKNDVIRHVRRISEKIKIGLSKIDKNDSPFLFSEDIPLVFMNEVDGQYFDKKSKKYCGISYYQFAYSENILKYADYFLEKREEDLKAKHKEKELSLQNEKQRQIIFNIVLISLVCLVVFYLF